MAEAAHINDSEEWRDVRDWEGVYQVSSLGRCRRLSRFVRCKNGAYRLHQTRILSGGMSGNYLAVTLTCEGKIERRTIHRMVCEAFNGPQPKGKTIVAHGNGDKFDNRAENVRWADAKDNADDREAHGRTHRGETVVTSKLSEADVRQIIAEYTPRYGEQTRLARMFGVTSAQIHNIVKGKRWAWV